MVLWQAACTAPDTEGATDTASADAGKGKLVLAEPAGDALEPKHWGSTPAVTGRALGEFLTKGVPVDEQSHEVAVDDGSRIGVRLSATVVLAGAVTRRPVRERL